MPFFGVIHRSAWKGYSPKFAGTEFSEVPQLQLCAPSHLLFWRTYISLGQEYGAPVS